MSLVSAFATAAHTAAAAMIGEETVTIGALSLSCVLAEASNAPEFSENGGFEARKTLTATCKTSAIGSTAIVKKTATARGASWRVDALSAGATFTTLTLIEPTRS